MSRSNYNKPFYVDVGTSMAAIRCASDGDVVYEIDHHGEKSIIKIVEDKCDRMIQEAEHFYRPLGNGQVPLCAAVAFVWGFEILRVIVEGRKAA